MTERDENIDELLEFLIKPERHTKNMLKLAEELSELSEVVLKWVNKSESNKPPMDKVIEESGDVLFRLGVVLSQFNIEDEVLDRAEEKATQVCEHYKEQIEKGETV